MVSMTLSIHQPISDNGMFEISDDEVLNGNDHIGDDESNGISHKEQCEFSTVSEEYVSLGAPSVKCEFCQAYMWNEERVNKKATHGMPKFSICYCKGLIKLPKTRPTHSFLWQPSIGFPNIVKTIANSEYTIKVKTRKDNVNKNSQSCLATDIFKGSFTETSTMQEQTQEPHIDESNTENSSSIFHLDGLSQLNFQTPKISKEQGKQRMVNM